MKRFCLAAMMLLAAAPVAARVKLPAVLGSNMVLQRNTEVNFWGGATPNSRVRVTPSWNGRSYETQADDAGRWALKVPTGEAGGPYTVTVSDGDPVVLENVLLGEVWICSGQSNMEMPVGGFLHQPVEGSAEAVAAAGDCPGIRMFTVPKVSSESPGRIARPHGSAPRRHRSAPSVPWGISSDGCSAGCSTYPSA